MVAAAAKRLRGPRKLIEGDSAGGCSNLRSFGIFEGSRCARLRRDATRRNETRFSATMGKIENESARAHHPSREEPISGRGLRERDEGGGERRNEDLSLPAANSREILWQSGSAKRVSDEIDSRDLLRTYNFVQSPSIAFF